MRRFLRENGLSVAAFGLFAICLVGQMLTGLVEHNDTQREHRQPTIGVAAYVRSGHFALHAVGGASEYSDEQLAHGGVTISTLAYAGTPRFWFESFQNWQSEFLSVGALFVLTIWFREKGSPQSKPVGAPHSQTGAE